jgi:hypothetical protein
LKDPGSSTDGSGATIIILIIIAFIIIVMIIAFVVGGFVGAFIQYATSQSKYDSAMADYIRPHWLALESSQHCERYGTRKYWAKMGPLVGGYDPMKACWTSEIEIHGQKMKPTYCEDKVCSANSPFHYSGYSIHRERIMGYMVIG